MQAQAAARLIAERNIACRHALKPNSMLIDGKWMAVLSGSTLESLDPSSDAVIAKAVFAALRCYA